MKHLVLIFLAAGLFGCTSHQINRTPMAHKGGEPTQIEEIKPESLPHAASQLAKQMVQDLPRTFTGTFKWDHMDGPGWTSAGDFVTLRIDSVNASGDFVHFRGIHIYEPDSQLFDIVGQIDCETHKLTILESKSGEPVKNVGPNLVSVAITNGSFDGNISDDLSQIDAVWTTNGRNMTGTLELKSKK